MAEIPPPSLHTVEAAKIFHHVGFEEVQRGEDGEAVKEGVYHRSQEQSCKGGKGQDEQLLERQRWEYGGAEERRQGKPGEGCGRPHHHTESGETKGAWLRIGGERDEEERGLQAGGEGARARVEEEPVGLSKSEQV